MPLITRYARITRYDPIANRAAYDELRRQESRRRRVLTDAEIDQVLHGCGLAVRCRLRYWILLALAFGLWLGGS